MHITTQQVIDALSDAEFKVRSYSGRGMNGRQCVGVSVDSLGAIMTIAVALNEAGVSDFNIIELGEHMHWDSMGLGQIIYWPTLKLTAEQIAQLRDEDDDEDAIDESLHVEDEIA